MNKTAWLLQACMRASTELHEASRVLSSKICDATSDLVLALLDVLHLALALRTRQTVIAWAKRPKYAS